MITGKRKRIVVLTVDKHGTPVLLHRVTVGYARRAIERGEAHPTEHPDCLMVDPTGLRELTGKEKRDIQLKKERNGR